MAILDKRHGFVAFMHMFGCDDVITQLKSSIDKGGKKKRGRRLTCNGHPGVKSMVGWRLELRSSLGWDDPIVKWTSSIPWGKRSTWTCRFSGRMTWCGIARVWSANCGTNRNSGARGSTRASTRCAPSTSGRSTAASASSTPAAAPAASTQVFGIVPIWLILATIQFVPLLGFQRLWGVEFTCGRRRVIRGILRGSGLMVLGIRRHSQPDWESVWLIRRWRSSVESCRWLFVKWIHHFGFRKDADFFQRKITICFLFFLKRVSNWDFLLDAIDFFCTWLSIRFVKSINPDQVTPIFFSQKPYFYIWQCPYVYLYFMLNAFYSFSLGSLAHSFPPCFPLFTSLSVTSTSSSQCYFYCLDPF